MVRSISAGLAYVGIVFAAGFVLGAIRVLVLLPRLGETTAVLLELPVILGISWFVCRWLVDRFTVPVGTPHRLAMGFVAFAVLMAAEVGVSVFGFGRTYAEHLARYRDLPAMIGLAGQIAFAAFPWIQARTRRDPSSGRHR